jgi:very-short-patch-repair endonuclease
MDPGEFRALVDRQGGLFTRAQARSSGFSGYRIRRRLSLGEWCPVLGPVLARAGTSPTPAVRDRAALLTVDGAVLSGPSAARRHGIPVADRSTWLTVAPETRVRLPGVRVSREVLPPTDLMAIEDLVLTSPERTVFDCLRWLPERHAEELLDRALQRGWIDYDWLVIRVRAFAGRPGVLKLVRLVRRAGPGARSAAERLLVAALRGSGLTGWQVNFEIVDECGDLIGVGDVVFVALRLVIEVDGRAWHSDADRFQRDRTRQNRLVAAGWTVLRFTWEDLIDRADEVIATIRIMYAQAEARRNR